MTKSATHGSGSLRAAVITVSDRCARGEREDLSGPAAAGALSRIFRSRPIDLDRRVVADDAEALARTLGECVSGGYDLVFTTGGTGIGPRDITPQTTRRIIEIEIPGIGEAMRSFSMLSTRNAALSRGMAGIAGRTLIVNLPGSPAAAGEILEYLGDTLDHALLMMEGADVHG